MAQRDVLPMARTEGLLTQELDDELLIYDRESHDAHSLAPAAATLWRACDGRTPVGELARTLGLARDEVEAALAVLEERGLMMPVPDGPRLSRRAALRGGLVAGGALAIGAPVIRSIVAPDAAAAGTAPCKPPGTQCAGSGECCSGNCFQYGGGFGQCF